MITEVGAMNMFFVLEDKNDPDKVYLLEREWSLKKSTKNKSILCVRNVIGRSIS